MPHHDPSPQDLPRLRRGAHEFLRRYAATAWQHQHDGNRWEIRLPPEIEAQPEGKRFRIHARQEARRLADAALYDLCPQTTRWTRTLGATIRENKHEEATALAGHLNVVATEGIKAPTETGFLRWRHPIAHNDMDAPIVACHWGSTADQGRWLVWWSDNYAMANAYAASARADGNRDRQHVLSVGVVSTLGPLWYDRQQLLQPHKDTPGPKPADDDVDASDLELIYTTLATWWLLTTPNDAIRISQEHPSADEQAADRAAGLEPGGITVAQCGG